ncbi:MAG: type II and III secretion system protein [Pontiellaceae bacterium]|nr:type II and III secretion system protein [Pontiellaceae bacterium]MBN2783884.1 type II and III secretion system protein [Pontiellaceae bacterium]
MMKRSLIISLFAAFSCIGFAQENPAPEPEQENHVPEELRYSNKPEWQMVAIEALVVEINEERAREFGLTYGLSTLDATGANASGIVDGANVGLGAQAFSTVPVAQLAENANGTTSLSFADRMPGLGISLAGIDVDTAVIAAQLRMLLDRGEAVVRTRPVAVALNRTEVQFETVDEIPYVDVNEKGNLGIQKKKAGVRLQVTPTIEVDYPGAVTLDISNIEISSGSTFITLQNVNRPVISVSRTKTRITLREGETFIVGGLKTRRTTMEEERVPILGRIPIIKWLFTSRREVERTVDVLFFITPSILDPGENFLLPYDFENKEFLGTSIDG